QYYGKLPDIEIQTEEDKTWRLALARMDLRKMTPELIEQNNQRFIQFKPSLESDIEKISQGAQEELEIINEISTLSCWSRFRFEGRQDKYERYSQYENNPNLVIEETKKIIEKFKDTSDKFNLFRESIPGYSCTVLIRDFVDLLSDEEKSFCKDVIFQYTDSLFKENYEYQIADGVEAAINALPYLLKHFSEEKFKIKLILLLTLFNEYPLGFDKRICDYSIEAIMNNRLWESSPEDANSIFLGYLELHKKFQQLNISLIEELYRQGVYNISFAQVINRFQKVYGSDLNQILNNQFSANEINNLEQIPLGALCTALEILPNELDNTEQELFAQLTFSLFAKYLFNTDLKQEAKDDELEPMLKYRFFEKFSAITLCSSTDKCKEYIKPFLESFNSCDNAAEFFNQLIIAQDKFNRYENFWFIWNSFYDKVVSISNEDNKRSYYSKYIIRSYLFSKTIWNEGIKGWHSLTDRQSLFFRRVSKDMGPHPAVLYSFSKILNGVAYQFQKEGIFWICSILDKYSEYLSNNLETDTTFYLENLVRNFVSTRHNEVKSNRQIKDGLVKVLDFLINKGSSLAYRLRESVL
ncbi:MAG: hypothetical protein SFU25_05875, partial [Candidatus Caenarcaniphilales bacterium]|nr:hypothetical protein [Candidatus Caenarcaniphilales bacterium]